MKTPKEYVRSAWGLGCNVDTEQIGSYLKR